MRVYGRFDQIGVLGWTSVEHGVDLLLESPLRRWVLREQIPGPGQCQRRRLLTRQQKRRHLNPKLLVGHRLAGFLVARRQQHGKQIAVGRRIVPALADDVIDGSPEYGPRGLELSVLRRWQPIGQSERPEALADMLIDDRPGMVDGGRERTEVGAEKRTEHDGTREPHHLFIDI